ncbi:MAG: glycosyltransferase, partial [Clostridiales bacterium]
AKVNFPITAVIPLEVFHNNSVSDYIKSNIPRYDLVIGVDRGVIEASFVAKFYRIPYGVISYEIMFAEETTSQYLVNDINASKDVSFAVCQDELRSFHLSKENHIPLSKIINIPVAGRSARRGVRAYNLHEILGIPRQKKIALYMGSVTSKWAGINEIIEEIDNWPDDWVLLLHQRYAQYENNFLREISPKKNIFISPYSSLPFDNIGELLNSVDLGLGIYIPQKSSIFEGNNLKYIGMASGKIMTYLQYGLPILINELGEMSVHTRQNQLGTVVENLREIPSALAALSSDVLSAQRENCISFFESELDLDKKVMPLLSVIQKVTSRENQRGEIQIREKIEKNRNLPDSSTIGGKASHDSKAKEKYPKITVVTPSFNQGAFLEECIQSVLSQNYPNLEYIIMDGGSTDNSVEIIKKYEKYLHYWQSKPDKGQYSAINEGFKLSSGEIMTWLNSDDKFHAGAFDTASKVFMKRSDIEWIMGRPNGIAADGSQAWVFDYLPQWNRAKYLTKAYKDPYIQQEGTFWRRSLWNEAGAYVSTEYNLAGDLELWTRFFRSSQLYTVDALLAGFRQHSDQKTANNILLYNKEAEAILNLEQKLFEKSTAKILKPAPNPVFMNSIVSDKEKSGTYGKTPVKESSEIYPFLLSAVVSVYNSERFIKGCLDDLINQTIFAKGQLEIVVVNTGSKQNEEAVIKEYQARYSNIKYIKTESRETVYQAWNRGVKAASGKYVTNANTDDRHRKNGLEILVSLLENNPDKVLAYGDSIITKVENETFEGCTIDGYLNWPDFEKYRMLEFCFIGPHPVWRKSVHEEFGYFDEKYITAADYEFWLRLAQKYEFIHTSELVGLYWLNEGTVSRKGNAPILEAEEIKRKYRDLYYSERSAKLDKNKILVITHNFPPYWFAGVENYSFNLVKALKQCGYNVHVIYPRLDPNARVPSIIKKRYQDIEVYELVHNHLDPLAAELNSKATEKLFEALLVKENYALAHFHHTKGMPYSLIPSARKLGLKVCLTLHDFWLMCPRIHLLKEDNQICSGPKTVKQCAECLASNYGNVENKTEKLEAIVSSRLNNIRNIFKEIDYISSPSEFLASKFHEYGFAEGNIHVSELGLSLPEGKIRKGIPDTLTFGYIGAIVPVKNVLMLAEAFMKAKTSSRLVIWGNGIESEIVKLKKLIAGCDNILYKGAYSPDQIGNILSGIDTVIIPSKLETYCFTVREALNFKVPVLASNRGGIPEIIKHGQNGLLFNPDNQQELINLIRKVNKTPAILNELRNNISPVRNIKQDAEYWASIYKDLLRVNQEVNAIKPDKCKFSIIIPVHNSIEYTSGCLEKIQSTISEDVKYEIIVIDNSSTDGTGEYLKTFKGPLKVIYNSFNNSYSKANNQGAAVAKGEYLLFLNNDTEVFPGWDSALIKTFEEDKEVGIQGGKLLYPNNTIQHAGIVYGPVKSGMNLHYHIYLCSPKDAPCVNKLREFQMVTGAMLAVRKDVFEKVKGFDENYQFGHEDLDLCLSARKAGYKVVYNPKAAAYHFESMTKKQQGLEKFALNLSDTTSMDYKNYKYFHEKWDEFLYVDADKYYIEDGFKKPLDSASLEKPKTKGKSILFTMYGWNESGGGTIFPKDVTKELVKRGYSVSVFYASLKNDSQMPPYSMEKTIEDGVRLYGLYNRPAPFIDPDNPEREVSDPNIEKVFTQVLKEVKPDVLHFNNFHGLTLSLARVAREHGIHSCYTPHNYHMIDPNLYLFNSDLSLWNGVDLLKNSEAVKRNPGKLQGYKKRILTAQKLMNEWVDVTIAVSSRQKQLLCAFGAAKNKIAVVHQSNKSTDALWNDNLLQEQQGRSLHSPVRIGFIGGVMPHKGVHMLVSAAQAFPKEKAEFHIFGFVSAEYLKLLNKIDKKHIVKFHGEFRQDQLNEIAGQMDIAVVPSIWEDCAPLVLLELLAMRLPIIAAEIGGIPDFVKDGVTGFLYKHDSVDDLKKVIAYCLDNPEKILAIRKSLKQEHSFVKYV